MLPRVDFSTKPVIGCIHLLPTPGSHRYDGSIARIYDAAIAEAHLLLEHGVDALVVENFRDGPFFPESAPAETIATLAGVTREIVRQSAKPVGVAVLRNDAEAAMSIATATEAAFIRVNVHVGAALAAQGLLTGKSHKTLRLRSSLRSEVAIWADAGVKHSKPFAYASLADEVHDLNACSDAVIISGSLTGIETETSDLQIARRATRLPILIGSGVTASNIHRSFELADGFIVGTALKRDGVPSNEIDVARVRSFMDAVLTLRAQARMATTGTV